MELSDNGLRLITQFEGCKLVSYQDSGDVWTIGYGHTDHTICEGITITDQQALDYLRQDTGLAQHMVNHLVNVPLAQPQYDALVSFTYNIGAGNLQHSELLRDLNQKNYLAAADQFLEWDKVGGVVVPGLARRRVAERALFLSSPTLVG